MRITHGMLTDRMLSDLRSGAAELARTQREVATGKRISRPSDDPVATAQVLARRTELGSVDGHRAGAADASAWLDATDTALGQLGDVVSRAKELAIQGSNGTYSAADRERIAAEVDQLVNAAKDLGNAEQGGRYLFSGTATPTRPYPGPGETYAGDAGAVVRQVGPGVSVSVGTTGASVLGNGQGAGDGLVLDTLRDLATALRAGTKPDLAALEANIDGVAAARAATGATQNRVDAAVARLDDVEELATRALSDLEDVDLAEALTRLASQQTAYQAALQTGARVLQPSLLDFLR